MVIVFSRIIDPKTKGVSQFGILYRKINRRVKSITTCFGCTCAGYPSLRSRGMMVVTHAEGYRILFNVRVTPYQFQVDAIGNVRDAFRTNATLHRRMVAVLPVITRNL